ERMLEGWRSKAERSQPVDVVTEMRRLSQTIIIEASFGDVGESERRALSDALDVAVGHVDRRLWSPFGWLPTPTLAAGRYRRALRAIDALVSRRVNDARRTKPAAGSLLRALVPAAPVGRRQGGGPINDVDVQDDVKAVLVAGHTTTARALAWTWFVLSQHRDVRDRLEDECRGVFGGDPATIELLPRLDYTRRVL